MRAKIQGLGSGISVWGEGFGGSGGGQREYQETRSVRGVISPLFP